MLKYAVTTTKRSAKEQPELTSIDDEQPLPRPPQPEDVDIMVSGFPWCVCKAAIAPPSSSTFFCISQPHSSLNMFQNVNDLRNELFLNTLSWVDHLRPKFCLFENVEGFVNFSLCATQDGPHRVRGGIEKGGIKFTVRALTAMGCVLSIFLLSVESAF